MDAVRCPVCRNRDGQEADGTVVREYTPRMKDGAVYGRLTPNYADQLKCKWCGTVLLVRRRGRWVQAHLVK